MRGGGCFQVSYRAVPHAGAHLVHRSRADSGDKAAELKTDLGGPRQEMTLHSITVRPAGLVLVTALAIFLGTGALTVFLAQEPEPAAGELSPAPVGEGGPVGEAAPLDPAAQPIAFSHAHHVTEIGIDCQFCHAYARRGPVAGIPSVQRCAGCHRVVLSEEPEILRVLEYWENEEPIPWVRVHDLPDHVRFTHKAHVRAGVACENCHGDVATMEAAVQVESLSMGWCVSCHEDRGATRDCLACHY